MPFVMGKTCWPMTNDESLMTKEFPMTNDECAGRGVCAASTCRGKYALKRAKARAPRRRADSSLRLRHSFVIRLSSFVISSLYLVALCRPLINIAASD